MITPLTRFYSIVISITVTLMFIGIHFSSNLITPLGTKGIVVGVISAALGSIGIYRILSQLLIYILEQNDWIMKIFLGPFYVKGTWIGIIKTASKRNLIIIEKYEQSLFSITARGWSYTLSGEKESDWFTESVQIEPISGIVYLFQTLHDPRKENVVESLGKLQFDRKKPKVGPTRMTGYFIDSDSSKKLLYENLIKESNSLLDLDNALKIAQDKFKQKD